MTILSIIIAIIVFGLLVCFHEFGHFIVAKMFGIGVTEFSVGMGPRIFSFKKGETRYSLKAIPFGGSCAMVYEDAAGGGEIDTESFKRDINIEQLPDNAFIKKAPWKRMLVVLAGPLFNILLAFILGIIITMTAGFNTARVDYVAKDFGAYNAGLKEGDIITSFNGHSINIGKEVRLYSVAEPLDGNDVELTAIRDGKKINISYDPSYERYLMGFSYSSKDDASLTQVANDSPAEKAGLLVGDVIKSVNGTKIKNGEELAKYYQEHELDSTPVLLVYSRAGADYETTITPKLTKEYTLGFDAAYTYDSADFITSLKGGLYETAYNIKAVVVSFKMLFTGAVSVKEISGPVGIVNVISNTVQESSADGVKYIALNVLSICMLLSANLGLMNMLPIPALDGGRFLTYTIEFITRKKLSPRIEASMNSIGFILLMGLMVFVLVNDIIKLF